MALSLRVPILTVINQEASETINTGEKEPWASQGPVSCCLRTKFSFEGTHTEGACLM